MSRTLKNTGIAANAVAVLAVDDDNTIGVWETPGSSTVLKSGSGLSLTGTTTPAYGGTTTWNGISSTPYMTFTNNDARVRITDTPLPVVGSTFTIYAAFKSYTNVYFTRGFIVTDETYNGLAIDEAANYLEGYVGTGSLGVDTVTPCPTGGTHFGVGLRFDNSSLWQYFTGNAGSSLAAGDGNLSYSSAATMVNVEAFMGLVAYSNRHVNAEPIGIAVFDSTYTLAELAGLHADFYGTLFESGTSVAPLAMVNSANIATPSLWLPSNRKFTY